MTFCCLFCTALHMSTLQTEMSQAIQCVLERSVLTHQGIDREQKPDKEEKKSHNDKMVLVRQNLNQSWTSWSVICLTSDSKHRADMESCASCPVPVAEVLHHKSTFSLPTIRSHEITRHRFEWKHSFYHWDGVRSQVYSQLLYSGTTDTVNVRCW